MNKKVKVSTKEFSESIIRSKEYRDYVEAREDMDEESIQQLYNFNKKQIDYHNGICLLKDVQELQEKVIGNPKIKNLTDSQTKLFALLRETNDLLSEELGTPFAFARGGGCCG